MTVLANAIALMNDVAFRDYVRASLANQARVVLTEAPNPDYDIRRQLALIIISNPNAYLDTNVAIFACDPVINTKGSTVAAVTEATFVAQAAAAWTLLSSVYCVALAP